MKNFPRPPTRCPILRRRSCEFRIASSALAQHGANNFLATCAFAQKNSRTCCLGRLRGRSLGRLSHLSHHATASALPESFPRLYTWDFGASPPASRRCSDLHRWSERSSAVRSSAMRSSAVRSSAANPPKIFLRSEPALLVEILNRSRTGHWTPPVPRLRRSGRPHHHVPCRAGEVPALSRKTMASTRTASRVLREEIGACFGRN